MPNPENILGQGFHTNPERINRTGLNKGSRWMSTLLREALEQKGPNSILAVLIRKAEEGDLNAIKEIFDRVEGKAVQAVEQKTEHSGGITINWEEPNV
jgi:hypothetical protein